MSTWPPAPIEGSFGKPSEHLTPTQLLDFRAASALLSWSNVLDKKRGTNNQIETEANYAALYDRLTHFVNLQVRHTEVAAATISDKKGGVYRAMIHILDEDEESTSYPSPPEKLY